MKVVLDYLSVCVMIGLGLYGKIEGEVSYFILIFITEVEHGAFNKRI